MKKIFFLILLVVTLISCNTNDSYMNIKYRVYYSSNFIRETDAIYECNEYDIPYLRSSRGTNMLYTNRGLVLSTTAPIEIISYKVYKK